MSLNNAAADALASSIVSQLGAAAGSLGQWQTICRALFASLVANGTVIITTGEIDTPGGNGPSAPVTLPFQ